MIDSRLVFWTAARLERQIPAQGGGQHLLATALDLGRRNETSSAKARVVLGFAPRPATTTIVNCAESLLGGKIGQAA